MLSQMASELFARLTVASNARLGEYIEAKQRRREWRTDYTREENHEHGHR